MLKLWKIDNLQRSTKSRKPGAALYLVIDNQNMTNDFFNKTFIRVVQQKIHNFHPDFPQAYFHQK